MIKTIIQTLYNNLLRPYLPGSKIGVYNGIPIQRLKILDRQIMFPDYEEPLIRSLRKYANKGDTILLVGGGYGASTIAAARAVEPEGDVIVYEAGKDYAEKVRETVKLNDVEDLVQIRTGIVGENRDAWGDTSGVDVVDPTDLPECDMLVLDCEGAEQTIIPQTSCNPRILIVESHGILDSPTKEVKYEIQNRGYVIEDVSAEVSEDDIYVVTAAEAGNT